MAKQKGKHESDKNQYSLYKSQGRYSKNRKAKLERHLKKYPNDEQARKALSDMSPDPRRGKPNSRVWSSTTRARAEMFASVGINGMHALESRRISDKIDSEHLRYDAEYKIEQMKKEKRNTPVVATKPTKRKGRDKNKTKE